jgi:hypothetical protein
MYKCYKATRQKSSTQSGKNIQIADLIDQQVHSTCDHLCLPIIPLTHAGVDEMSASKMVGKIANISQLFLRDRGGSYNIK